MPGRDDVTATAPVIEVAGTALADKWLAGLVEVRVERAFQVPSRVTLRFSDPGHELLTSGLLSLGTLIKVSAIGQGDLATVEVTGFTAEHQPLSPPELVVIGHDKAHRLGRANQVATFQDMTYSTIVQQLAQKAGLQFDIQATSRKLAYMLQVESSLALITELANRVGYDWWVEADTLYFKAPNTSA